MPHPKSSAWAHFKRAADDKSVKCSLCGTELVFNGGTTSMRNHLRLKHPSSASQSPTKETHSSMTSFISTPKKLSSSHKENITQAIAHMVVSDYVHLSIVEAEGFRSLMKLVAPEFEIPCRKTIRARIIKKYGDEKEALCKELENVSSASLTTDTWTSTATDSYITVTEHHITDSWEMKSNVLLTRAMPERHTGINIAGKLHECVTEFGLDTKVESCVHDNARNMECAGNLCPEWSDYGCFAHTLQLCIKPALEIPQVEKTVSKCRKLVGHFKHSTTVTAEMRKRQAMFSLPEHELIQDVCTRWNSCQMMLERLTEQRRVITDIMLDSNISKKSDSLLLLTERERECIAEISSVLKDLTQVTTFMSGEKDVSCSYVYPVVCGQISSSLSVEAEDSSVTRKMKDSISHELQRRFKPLDTETAATVPALAALLDPRYKHLKIFTPDQRQAAEDALESRLDDIPLRLARRDTEDQPPAKKPRTDGALSFLTFQSPEKAKENDELQEYVKERGGSVMPLTWWKENGHKYPRISIIARKLLAVPATSVPSERVFSSAGLLVNKLRNRTKH